MKHESHDEILALDEEIIRRLGELEAVAPEDSKGFFEEASKIAALQLDKEKAINQERRLISAARVDKYISKYLQKKHKNVLSAIDKAMLEKQAYLGQITEFLSLGTEKEFLERLAENPAVEINRMLDKYDLATEHEESLAKDLQSLKRIGETGQRIGLYFEEAEEEYPESERTPVLANLLGIKDDIKMLVDHLLRNDFLSFAMGAGLIYCGKALNDEYYQLMQDIGRMREESDDAKGELKERTTELEELDNSIKGKAGELAELEDAIKTKSSELSKLHRELEESKERVKEKIEKSNREMPFK